MTVLLAAGALPLSQLAALLCTECPLSLWPIAPKRLVTNSKEVKPGDLFCAIRGKSGDGHLHTKEAARRGAVAVLSEEETAAACPHILVPDTRKALGLWAKETLKRFPCLRIGITGSVGKTTTKNAVAAFLSVAFRVHATEGNFNNDLGLPFTVLSMPRDTEILVAELGTNAPGEIAYLAGILAPHKSVITSIGHAHIGAFGSLEAIGEEKAALFSATDVDGELFSMSDQPIPPHSIFPSQRHHRLALLSEAELAPYGISPPSEIAAHSALTIAFHLGCALGLDREAMQRGVFAALCLPTRATVHRLGGLTLIEDAYNAAPESMRAALAEIKKKDGRRVAVLGTMRELGKESERLHAEIGGVAAHSVDLFLPFGEFSNAYLTGARRENERVFLHPLRGMDPRALAHEISLLLLPCDTVLFKASRAEQADAICLHLISMLKGRCF